MNLWILNDTTVPLIYAARLLTFILHYRRIFRSIVSNLMIVLSSSGVRTGVAADARNKRAHRYPCEVLKDLLHRYGDRTECREDYRMRTKALEMSRGDNSGELIKRQRRDALYINNRICTRVHRKRKRKGKRSRTLFIPPLLGDREKLRIDTVRRMISH